MSVASIPISVHISTGQSWRSAGFPTIARRVGAEAVSDVLSPHLTGPSFGPLGLGAGKLIAGEIDGLVPLATTTPDHDSARKSAGYISIGRAAVIAQQRLRRKYGKPVRPILEYGSAYPRSGWTTGEGGGLGPGSVTWSMMLKVREAIARHARRSGYVPTRETIGWTQGGDRHYAPTLANLKAMVAAHEALDRWGRARLFYITQTSPSATRPNMPSSALARLDFCQSNAARNVFLVPPWYAYPLIDNTHLGALGTIRTGEMEGVAKYVTEDEGARWTPLVHHWKDPITLDGRVVSIPMRRPAGAMFANARMEFSDEKRDENRTKGGRQGFHVERGGEHLVVEEAYIDDMTVRLRLAEARKVGDILAVSYAWHGEKSDKRSACWGNLKMTATGPDGEPMPSVLMPGEMLDCWACHFRRRVDVR